MTAAGSKLRSDGKSTEEGAVWRAPAELLVALVVSGFLFADVVSALLAKEVPGGCEDAADCD